MDKKYESSISIWDSRKAWETDSFVTCRFRLILEIWVVTTKQNGTESALDRVTLDNMRRGDKSVERR